MKRFILAAMVAVFFGVLSCQQEGDSNEVVGPFGAKGNQRIAACTYTTLSGNITTNTTLSASNVYLLSGCVTVTAGATLTIPAGTVIHGEKATKGGLLIDRGSQLFVNGTAANPVIFTSDQAAGSRAAGDWRGIAILGKANTNGSGATVNVVRCGTTYTAGAISGISTDSDNSGSLQYMQIHYAGYTTGSENFSSAILFAAVGSATTVDHIEVTNSLKDGVSFVGGIVSTKYVVSVDNYKADFRMDYGYRGYMQFGLAIRKNASANDGATGFSNGLVIQNNPTSPSSTPYTNPVLSNISIVGPGYCTSGSLSSNFKNGVLFAENARGHVYNSLVTGWPQGLLYDQLSTVQNANNAVLKWMYNSFYGYSSAATAYNFAGPASWNNPAGVCTSTIGAYITNTNPLLTCASLGHQSLTSGLGFNSNVCGDYCTTAPNFALSSSGINSSSYPSGSPVTASFFDTSSKPRGAFSTSTAWTGSWTNWCPQNSTYCP